MGGRPCPAAPNGRPTALYPQPLVQPPQTGLSPTKNDHFSLHKDASLHVSVLPISLAQRFGLYSTLAIFWTNTPLSQIQSLSLRRTDGGLRRQVGRRPAKSVQLWAKTSLPPPPAKVLGDHLRRWSPLGALSSLTSLAQALCRAVVPV